MSSNPPSLDTSPSSSPPAAGSAPIAQQANASRRVSFSPFSFPASPTTAVTNVATSAANRIAGIGKTFRRGSLPQQTQSQQQFAGDRGNVESKEPDIGDLPPKTAPESLGKAEPSKKVSSLEDENLSKILHRRSRPRSAKLAQLVQEARALQEKKEQAS